MTNVSESSKLKDEHRMAQLSYDDQLTDLPTRILFENNLQQRIIDSQRNQSFFALVLLDLNRSRFINETLGYRAGNLLMKEAAQRLNVIVCSEDSLSRIGDDKFALFLPTDSGLNELMDKVHLLLLTLDEAPFHIDNFEFQVTATIGISLYPDAGHDDVTLLKHAEVALYRAKEEKHRVGIYSPDIDIRTYKTFTLENDLRKALSNNEFELLYQPRINTVTNQIIGPEALIRWNHPNWGEVSPSEFIPLAEQNGLINQIGMWVLETVCKQIRAWEMDGIPFKKVSLNFSALQLIKPGIVQDVIAVLHNNKVNPNMIEIEITENTLMTNKEFMQNVINQFSQLGIHIAIDDFGTGYSALSYLLNFDIHTIKIDRFFIKDLATNNDSMEITSALIKLGQKLKLNVVAEGVETPEQLAILRRMQCNEIQGYLYSKAVDPQEFGRMLIKGKLEPVQTLGTAPVTNQRNFFRISFTHPLEADMTIIEINKVKVNVGKTLVLVVDLGPGGIRFLSNIKLPNKQGIVLGFDTYVLDHSLKLYGQIVWSKEVGDNYYEYGVELSIDEADRANLTKLLNQLQIQFRRKSDLLTNSRFAKNTLTTYLEKQNNII